LSPRLLSLEKPLASPLPIFLCSTQMHLAQNRYIRFSNHLQQAYGGLGGTVMQLALQMRLPPYIACPWLPASCLKLYIFSCFINTYNCFIENRFVDGSCIGCPTRAKFRGVIRNSTSVWIAGLFGFISYSKDILHDELISIHSGLSLANNMGFLDSV